MHRGHLAQRGLHAILLAVGVAVIVVASAAERTARAAGVDAADLVAPEAEVRLSTEGHTVAEMVAVVRDHARRTPGADPTAPVTVILTGDLAEETGDDRALLGGLRRGHDAWVRTDLAWPERTLVHEVAHVLADGDGHGPVWRAVYLGAVEQLFGEHRADRERRRIAWVHDRCYRTDTCASRSNG
jgi:hypothetical protein